MFFLESNLGTLKVTPRYSQSDSMDIFAPSPTFQKKIFPLIVATIFWKVTFQKKISPYRSDNFLESNFSEKHISSYRSNTFLESYFSEKNISPYRSDTFLESYFPEKISLRGATFFWKVTFQKTVAP